MNGGAVSWCSSKQSVVAGSTCEAEYMAASEAAHEAIWVKEFITDLGVIPNASGPIKLFCDSTHAEHGTHLAIEDAACLGSGRTKDVDALVVETHILETLDVVLSEMADYAVAACDRHGQTAAVALETATDAAVFGVEVIDEGLRLLFLGNLYLALQFLCLGNGATVFLVALLLSLALGCLCLLLLAGEFGLLSCQFLGLALSLRLGTLGFLGCLALCLGDSPLAGFLHLDGHEAVDLGIDGCITLLLSWTQVAMAFHALSIAF